MKAPKIILHCDGCHEKKKARFRTLVDRYLCEDCYRRPPASLAPLGALPGSPRAVGAGQTGESIAVNVETEAAFDLRHLQR